jgi:hypothetical protein
MLQTSTAQADTQRHIVNVDEQEYLLREYVGVAPKRGIYVEGNEANGNSLPQGFLVSQPPHSTTRAHFHESNQFQVFVDGDGHFGKQPAAPLTVQYANGHTPYGPIKAGSNGIMYFTLRQRWDPGAKYMPQMRDRLVRGNQRQRLVGAPQLLSAQALAQVESAHTQTLIEPEPDGLYALLCTLGSGQLMQLEDAARGGGQYHVVVNGALLGDADSALDRWSCQYAFPEDGEVPVQAAQGGAQVLILRFPKL